MMTLPMRSPLSSRRAVRVVLTGILLATALAAVPALGRHRHAVDADGEAAEHRDFDPHRWILLPRRAAEGPPTRDGRPAGARR